MPIIGAHGVIDASVRRPRKGGLIAVPNKTGSRVKRPDSTARPVPDILVRARAAFSRNDHLLQQRHLSLQLQGVRRPLSGHCRMRPLAARGRPMQPMSGCCRAQKTTKADCISGINRLHVDLSRLWQNPHQGSQWRVQTPLADGN
jgi:hypothetical protein